MSSKSTALSTYFISIACVSSSVYTTTQCTGKTDGGRGGENLVRPYSCTLCHQKRLYHVYRGDSFKSVSGHDEGCGGNECGVVIHCPAWTRL